MYGFDLTELEETIRQLESVGANMNSIAETVLEAGSEPAMEAFKKNVPFDKDTPEERHNYEHAQNTVKVSKTKIAKRTKNRYRLIEAKTTKKGADGKLIPYLYYREYGTTRDPAEPFIEKAYREAQAAAAEPMRQAFIKEYEKYMR